MRKHWLVFTLVLTFLAAAATAQAAAVPERLNGTTWRFTGFQLNKATDTPSVLYGRSLISDYNSTTQKGGLNGTLNVFNSTSGSAGSSVVFDSSLNNMGAERDLLRERHRFAHLPGVHQRHQRTGLPLQP